MKTLPRAYTPNPALAAIYPKYIGSEAISDDLRTGINRIGARYNLQNKKNLRGAAVIYFGLCILKQFKDEGKQEDIKKICGDIYREFKPGDAGNISFSTAVFTPGDASTLNHMTYVENAAGIYLPSVSNRKAFCFVFTVLGIRLHPVDAKPEHEDESWLATYAF